MSVRAVVWASRAVAYRLTRSPGDSLKSSSEMVVDAGRGLGPLAAATETVFSGLAIDGVMQRHFVQAEIVLAFYRHGDFFDGIDARIASRAGDAHGGRLVLLRLDEVIVAQAHVFALSTAAT